MHKKLSSVRAPGDINCLPASIWQASVSFKLQRRLAPSWPLKGPFPLTGFDNLALAQDLCWTAWASHTKPAVRAAPSTRCSPAATTAACPTRTPSSAPTLTSMAAPLYSPSGPSRPAKRSDFSVATQKPSTAGSCILHCGCGRLDTLSLPAFGKNSIPAIACRLVVLHARCAKAYCIVEPEGGLLAVELCLTIQIFVFPKACFWLLYAKSWPYNGGLCCTRRCMMHDM